MFVTQIDKNVLIISKNTNYHLQSKWSHAQESRIICKLFWEFMWNVAYQLHNFSIQLLSWNDKSTFSLLHSNFTASYVLQGGCLDYIIREV